MDVLRRLAHSRALDRLGQAAVEDRRSPAAPVEPVEPVEPVATVEARGVAFEKRELALELQPPLAGPGGFGEGCSDRPAVLGRCLDRLELADEPALARDLACLGANRGDRAVCIDTETTGLGGVAVPFLIGLAWHEAGKLRIVQWCLARLGGEAELLADVLASLRRLGPDPLVSFNGASFDLPLLRLRARRYGLRADVLDADHVDLLHPARRMQKGRGRDCRLTTLERDLLAIERRGDIDSAEIPQVFWSWLQTPTDPVAQRRMRAVCDHNLVDLASLPALASSLAQLVRAPGDLDRARRSARHLLRLGADTQARLLLARFVEPGLAAGASASTSLQWREAALELATLERRAGRRDRAAILWEAAWLGDPGCPVASEAWAKHLEHHVGDLPEALRVARGSRLRCERRLARLEQRLASRPQSPQIEPSAPAGAPVPAPAQPSADRGRARAPEPTVQRSAAPEPGTRLLARGDTVRYRLYR